MRLDPFFLIRKIFKNVKLGQTLVGRIKLSCRLRFNLRLDSYFCHQVCGYFSYFLGFFYCDISFSFSYFFLQILGGLWISRVILPCTFLWDFCMYFCMDFCMYFFYGFLYVFLHISPMIFCIVLLVLLISNL